MKKLHGMRKASGMTKDITTGFYVQISLDLSDGEILAALVSGEPTQAFRRYQSEKIYPVLNTTVFISEGEVAEAALKALDPALKAQAQLEKEKAERLERQKAAELQKKEETDKKLQEMENLMRAGKLPMEDFMAGNGLYKPEAGEEEVVFCLDCLSIDCDNWRHNLIPLDEKMYPVIKSLYTKGYRTSMCCSGHAGEPLGEYSTYVTFVRNYGFQPPEGFCVADPRGPYDKHAIVRLNIPSRPLSKKVMVEDARMAIEKNLSVLRQWVDDLPDVGSD